MTFQLLWDLSHRVILFISKIDNFFINGRKYRTPNRKDENRVVAVCKSTMYGKRIGLYCYWTKMRFSSWECVIHQHKTAKCRLFHNHKEEETEPVQFSIKRQLGNSTRSHERIVVDTHSDIHNMHKLYAYGKYLRFHFWFRNRTLNWIHLGTNALWLYGSLIEILSDLLAEKYCVMVQLKNY